MRRIQPSMDLYYYSFSAPDLERSTTMNDQIQRTESKTHPPYGQWWTYMKYVMATLLLLFAIQNAKEFHDRHDFYATGGADFKIYLTAAEILNIGHSGKMYEYTEQLTVQRKLYPLWP